jgi:hypothetical protein
MLSHLRMKVWIGLALSALVLMGCSKSEEQHAPVDATQYKVQTREELQQRFDALNVKLTADFNRFKKVESNAFAHQFPFDANNLQSLNQHLVGSTSLKTTKVAYCDMMNGYFAEMYRLGHHNLDIIDQVKLPKAEKEDLAVNFNNPDQFYTFILDRYTTYRQVQQTMGYGCNLKAAL